MPCDVLDLGGGATAIICSRGRRGPSRSCSTPGCGRRAVAQCDYPLKGKAAGRTCSKRLCERCLHRQPGRTADGDTVDFCAAHNELSQRESLADGKEPER